MLDRISITCVLIIFILISCHSDKKNLEKCIPMRNYNVTLVENYTPQWEDLTISLSREKDYQASIRYLGYYLGDVRFMYSWNKQNHILPDDDLEIVFTRERVGQISLMKPENYLISVKYIDNHPKACFIIWQNSGVSLSSDTNYYRRQKHSVSKADIIFSKAGLNGYYSWEIDEKTDSLYTNLDLSTVICLFPKFVGVYKHIAVDSIFLDYDYPVETYDFFYHIKFNNFTLGYTRDYCKMIEYANQELKKR